MNITLSVDVENAFNNSKSFYDVNFHKVGIEKHFFLL